MYKKILFNLSEKAYNIILYNGLVFLMCPNYKFECNFMHDACINCLKEILL